MAVEAMMPGPDGQPVKCYRRSVRQIRAGDWLPDHAGTVIAAPVADPENGSVWVALDTGADVELSTRKAWLHRRYDAPAWMADALDAYRCAVAARDAARESGAPVPAGLVAGTAGSAVAWCQLEPGDFAAAYPAPRLSAFIRAAAHAARRPEGVES